MDQNICSLFSEALIGYIQPQHVVLCSHATCTRGPYPSSSSFRPLSCEARQSRCRHCHYINLILRPRGLARAKEGLAWCACVHYARPLSKLWAHESVPLRVVQNHVKSLLKVRLISKLTGTCSVSRSNSRCSRIAFESMSASSIVGRSDGLLRTSALHCT